MEGNLDELYFTWLYGHVSSVRLKNASKTHWSLLRQLYSTEFVWTVPNDDNRVEDGQQLRYEFLHEDYHIENRDWLELGCSFFEMMIGLSRRLSFETEREPRWWFWQLMRNLDLEKYNDTLAELYSEEIEEVLNRVIWRTYGDDGVGGMFPLQYPDRDQRRVELWYQASAYLAEHDY